MTPGLDIALVSLHTSPLEMPGRGDAGGLNVQLVAIAAQLARRGNAVTIFTRRTDPTQATTTELPDGVRVVSLDIGPLAPLPKEDLVELLPECSQALATATGAQPPSVWHAHYWLSGAATSDVARDQHRPLIVNLHTIAAQKHAHLAAGEPAEAGQRAWWECRLAHDAELVTGSRYEKSMILRHYDARTFDVHIVRPGVDTETFAPGRARPLAETGGAPYFVVMGRVQPFKGQDLAIDAYAELLALAPQRPEHLVIAGEPTPGAETFAAALRERARAADLADRVHFLPAQSRPDAAALLAGATVTLVPSRSETYGLVALESAACGTPVLAQRVAGLLDSIRQGVSGELERTRDPRRWAAKLADMVSDPGRLDHLSTSARTYALRHTWARHAARLERLYARSIQGGLISNLPLPTRRPQPPDRERGE